MKAHPQTKDKRISARVTEKEFKAITKAAKQSKTTVADYIRLSILG